MSTREAMRFIEALGTDPVVRERLRRLGLAVRLEDVGRLAGELGFAFTPNELRRAFADDWQMRARFYSATGYSATGALDPASGEEPG